MKKIDISAKDLDADELMTLVTIFQDLYAGKPLKEIIDRMDIKTLERLASKSPELLKLLAKP